MSTILIPDPEVRRLVRKAVDQGCTMRETASGAQILTPSGGIVTLHRGKTANRRRLQFLRSDLRRSGVQC